jgi:hypothetical protein
MRSTLFWRITHRIVLIPYRRFGTTHRSHLEGRFETTYRSHLQGLLEGVTDGLCRNVGKELPLYAAQYPKGAQVLPVEVTVKVNLRQARMAQGGVEV